jgi:hypothetical protein
MTFLVEISNKNKFLVKKKRMVYCNICDINKTFIKLTAAYGVEVLLIYLGHVDG